MVNFLIILFVSQLATQMTHHYSLNPVIGPIRASSGLTLLFIGLTSAFSDPLILTLQAVFLGSSFVGMTDPQRLQRKQLVLASLIFCLIFNFLIIYLKGFSGTLGLSAFISCLITYGIEKKSKFLHSLS